MVELRREPATENNAGAVVEAIICRQQRHFVLTVESGKGSRTYLFPMRFPVGRDPIPTKMLGDREIVYIGFAPYEPLRSVVG